MNHVARSNVNEEGFVYTGWLCGGADLKGAVGSDGDGGAEEFLVSTKDHANLSTEGRATMRIGLPQTGWAMVTQLIEALFQVKEELSKKPISVNEPV